jgi:ABC-type phosphate/phosphonate transport system substrate-binding protein
VELKKFYGSVRKTDDADEALDDLADGKTQAVLVEKAAWERFQTRKPTMAGELVVLKESEDFIPAVIAYIPDHMPEGWSDIFRKGMIAANTNPATAKLMMLVKISSFLEVPEDFEDRAAEMLKRYPPSDK